MKPAYTTEILLILFSAFGGIIVWNAPTHWIWKIIIGTLWFSMCSKLAGQLKKDTLDEYIKATSSSRKVSRKENVIMTGCPDEMGGLER